MCLLLQAHLGRFRARSPGLRRSLFLGSFGLLLVRGWRLATTRNLVATQLQWWGRFSGERPFPALTRYRRGLSTIPDVRLLRGTTKNP